MIHVWVTFSCSSISENSARQVPASCAFCLPIKIDLGSIINPEFSIFLFGCDEPISGRSPRCESQWERRYVKCRAWAAERKEEKLGPADHSLKIAQRPRRDYPTIFEKHIFHFFSLPFIANIFCNILGKTFYTASLLIYFL